MQQQQEKQEQRRSCQVAEDANSRTSSQANVTEKQFSIDSILGKDDRENTDYNEMFQHQSSPFYSNSSQNKSFYRDMAEFEDLRREGGRRMKAKRIRTIFTPEQLERMEDEFNKTQYMVGPDRVLLASRLNLTEAQVKVWFQNRRIKWRKQNQHFNQNKLEILRSKQQQHQSVPGMMYVKQEDDGDEEDISQQIHVPDMSQHHQHHLQPQY